MLECEICGRQFKSTQGLTGHKRLSHGDIAKPNAPDEHVLAEALVSTLDGLGEHRELLTTLQANIAVIDTRLDSFQRSLTPPDGHNPPSLELIRVWEACSYCAPKWAELKEVLWQRLHDEKLAALKALGGHSDEALVEHSDEAGVESSEHSGETVPEHPDELRRAWLITVPGGGHHGFRWDDERSLYCLLVGDAEVAEEWKKKGGFEVVELAGDVLDAYEAEVEKPELKTSPGYFPGSKWDEKLQLFVEQR